MMPVTPRDYRAVKRALRPEAKCRIHPTEQAATCQRCYAAALAQQDVQWRREREAAHSEYLQRTAL